MTLKMIFLGSGSAFITGPSNYHSNILFQFENDSLLFDAGTDIRFSLPDQGFSYRDVRNIYISHLHLDHCGGVDWLALSTYFDPNYSDKPTLFGSEHIISPLWNNHLSAGLSTLAQVPATLDTYFNVNVIKQHQGFDWQSIHFDLVQTVHYYSGYELMPSYGLIFSYNGTRIFITSDTQCAPEQLLLFYEEADIIFHDCETAKNRSTVHAHYSDLVKLPLHLKNKMWLYHYNDGVLPDAQKDGFLGFVVKGQIFSF